MNARIEKDFVFLSSVYFEKTHMLNLYTMTLYIDILTDNDKEQLTAMERIFYFLTNYVENSVFINKKEKKQIELYEKAGIQVLTLPEDPFDQIVGLILLRKFNSITEGRVNVTEIKFGSKLSADIRFHNFDEESDEFDDETAWYNESALNVASTIKKTKKEKVVKFNDIEDWNKIGLVWKS
jgi:hypothetical protein